MDGLQPQNKPRVFRAPQARQDLLDSADYIAEDSLDASDRFLQATETAFKKLAEMPGMGRLRDVENVRLAGIRQWLVPGFEKNLIFYRIVEGGIEIVRVLHGARDIDAVLLDETPGL